MKALAALACATLGLAGCASMAPGTITRDRFDYVASISDSWKRETLLNLVKMRYADAPVFVEVVSIINSYSWEADLNVGGQLASPERAEQFLSLGAAGRYADRPTISYAPLTGEKFARSILAPFPLTALLSLLQTGYRADLLLRVGVSRINGLDNAYASFGDARSGSAEFHELLAAFRKVQAAGRIDIGLKSSEGKEMVLVFGPPADPEGAHAERRIRELLRLDPVASQFDVVHRSFSSGPREIAILARSMQQVMIDLASYIDVPAADVVQGRVYAPVRSAEQLRMYPPPVRVYSGEASPTDAQVAVRYRGRWFWIDDRDVQSKAVFNFLLFMFSLTETGGQHSAPVLTLPAR